MEIWHELRGNRIYSVTTNAKTTYQSIQKTQTYTPATNNKDVLLARLLDHIERAFIKARRYNYRVGTIQIFLKTQKFTFSSTTIKLPEKISYPFLVRGLIREAFNRIFNPKIMYRASGCTISEFGNTHIVQDSLFSPFKDAEEKLKKFYPLIDQKKISFGSSLRHKEKVNKKMFQYQTITS